MQMIKAAIFALCVSQSATSIADDITVIFEAGFGTKSDTWSPVIAHLPKAIRVLNETRRSVKARDAKPTTLAQDVATMRKKVKEASLDGNVIVVGHSYGGLVATETLKTSLSAIDGMVLVEPTTSVHRLRFKALDKERVIADDQAVAKYIPSHLRLQYQVLVDTLDNANPELTPLPSALPTIIFTSTKVYSEPMFIEETARGKTLWLSLHNKLFEQVIKGQHIRSDEWGHSVHTEAPDVIAKAIMDVAGMMTAKSKHAMDDN